MFFKLNTKSVIIGSLSLVTLGILIQQSQALSVLNVTVKCSPFVKISETVNVAGCPNYCFLFKTFESYFDAILNKFHISNAQSYIRNFAEAVSSFPLRECGSYINNLRCKS